MIFVMVFLAAILVGNNVGGETYSEIEATYYEGEYKDGKPHGQGIKYYEDGTKMYEGEFKEGLSHGHFVFCCILYIIFSRGNSGEMVKSEPK